MMTNHYNLHTLYHLLFKLTRFTMSSNGLPVCAYDGKTLAECFELSAKIESLPRECHQKFLFGVHEIIEESHKRGFEN